MDTKTILEKFLVIGESGKRDAGDRICSMTNGSNILYRDDNHLNLIGSAYIGKRMVEDNKDIFGHSN
jgi:hypothetical protein